jgi:hypothetical protein
LKLHHERDEINNGHNIRFQLSNHHEKTKKLSEKQLPVVVSPKLQRKRKIHEQATQVKTKRALSTPSPTVQSVDCLLVKKPKRLPLPSMESKIHRKTPLTINQKN